MQHLSHGVLTPRQETVAPSRERLAAPDPTKVAADLQTKTLHGLSVVAEGHGLRPEELSFFQWSLTPHQTLQVTQS